MGAHSSNLRRRLVRHRSVTVSRGDREINGTYLLFPNYQDDGDAYVNMETSYLIRLKEGAWRMYDEEGDELWSNAARTNTPPARGWRWSGDGTAPWQVPRVDSSNA